MTTTVYIPGLRRTLGAAVAQAVAAEATGASSRAHRPQWLARRTPSR
jgi:hypothetical protein